MAATTGPMKTTKTTKKPKTTNKPRVVPGFSAQARQKNTVVAKPRIVALVHGPAASTHPSDFAVFFRRPSFPLAAGYGVSRFRWRVPLETVDYERYMPIIADGLRDRLRPNATCATLGMWHMLDHDKADGLRVLSALPRTMPAVRRALELGATDWQGVVRGLKTVIKMTQLAGPVPHAMVPYYHGLLAPVNRYLYDLRLRRVTVTDGLNPNVKHKLHELCEETMAALERTGGPCAFVNIKYAVPTYDSKILPSRAAQGSETRAKKLGDSVIMVRAVERN